MWARIVGGDVPDQAWLLHPCDAWIANPHYQGPPVPHPESEWDTDREAALIAAHDAELEGLHDLANEIRHLLDYPIERPASYYDDVPF